MVAAFGEARANPSLGYWACLRRELFRRAGRGKSASPVRRGESGSRAGVAFSPTLPIGLIGDPAQKTVLDEAGFLMEAFTGTGKLVRGATRYEQKQPKPRYLTLGSPAARAGPSGADWMSVTTVSSDEAAF